MSRAILKILKIFFLSGLFVLAAELGFSIKHSRAGQPQGRGRIERWFRTVAEKCEPLLKEQIKSGKVATLYEVNSFFAAWLERRYHSRRHSTLKMSPRDALEKANISHLNMSRQVEPATAWGIFMAGKPVSKLAWGRKDLRQPLRGRRESAWQDRRTAI